MSSTHETDRLTLTPWEASDLDAFHAIWGDPKVIFWGPMADEDASRGLLADVIARSKGLPPGFGWLKAVVRETGEVAGSVFLQPHRYGDGWELGYHVRLSLQGHGYATEASRALIDFALQGGEHPVLVLILPSNAPSQRVAAKLGVTHMGRRIHADLLHDVYEAR